MAHPNAHHGSNYNRSREYRSEAYEHDVAALYDDAGRVPGERRTLPKIVAGVAVGIGVILAAIYGSQFVNTPELGETPLVVNTEPDWRSFELTPEFSQANAIYIRNQLGELPTAEPSTVAAQSSEAAGDAELTPASRFDATGNAQSTGGDASGNVNQVPERSGSESGSSSDTSVLSDVPRRDVPVLESESGSSSDSPTDDIDLDVNRDSVAPDRDQGLKSGQPNVGGTDRRDGSDVRGYSPTDNPY